MKRKSVRFGSDRHKRDVSHIAKKRQNNIIRQRHLRDRLTTISTVYVVRRLRGRNIN